jgi:tetratricopeptide (TPR) repeat protein
MSRLLALALASALIAGCATLTPVEKQDVDAEQEPAEHAEPAPERPFPSDSLYQLLVAEFALRRQAYDISLNNYLKEAPALRDAGVSAHATHLAQFMQRQDEALVSARLWAELDPQNAEANNTVAGLLAQQGRTLEALPYLEVVERQTGAANFAMLLTGFTQLSVEQRDELVGEIDRLSQQYPENTRLMLAQALIHTEYKQYDLALENLDDLLDLEPENPQAILLESKILIEQKAKNPYARVERALAKNPDDNKLRLQYARLLTATDMPAAREQFEILSQQSPQDGDLLFSLALINRETGDPAAAREYLQKTIALDQHVGESYYYLGRIAEEENKPEEAISNYSKVGPGPEYLAASSRLGQILVDAGDLQRSNAWFAQQREQLPPLREQLYGLEADILSRAGLLQEAHDLLTRALAETPDSTGLRYARAMISEQLDDLDAMENDLRALIAADPDNATALNALGYTLADRTQRYAEAQQLIERALQLQPNEPAILDSMGWVLYRTGRYDESVEFLSRAYARFPDPEVAAHLGEVLWVRGDRDSAVKIWSGALSRDPEHRVLLETLQRLAVDVPVAAPAANKSPTPTQP